MKNAPKEAKSLLRKKIKELTPEDLAQLEKPLGTPDRPFPMWGTVSGVDNKGRPVLEQQLTMVADDQRPMMVYSDRAYADVVALAYCDMPVPSMLPNMYDILERARPESKSRAYMMIGDPGFGKSFLGALAGRLGSKEPVNVLDCGGKNMRELLFEMVLDFGSGEALPDAIDKRLKAGTLKSLSLGLIEQFNTVETKPAGLSEKQSKDWDAQHIIVTKDANDTLSIDWEKLRAGSKEKIEGVYNLLTRISKIEGLDNAGGNALGMNSQYGPAIRAFMEGRPIVFDEYNKSREGTDDSLQTYLQFIVGEIDVCTVQNPLKNKDNSNGPDSFTFRREDMKLGHFAILTGNKKEDGVTTRSLNKSVYSRLDPQVLADPTPQDWQHRLCQIMSGMPVSTLANVFQPDRKKDKKAFGDWLLSLRRKKAEITGEKTVPPLQETLLRNWDQLVDATERLGNFYSKWQKLTDVDKIIAENASDLGMEVDEEYSKRTSIDFRKVIKHVEEALPVRPRMSTLDNNHVVKFGKWDQPPELTKKEVESVSLHFGTRLTDLIMRKVYETSGAIGKEKLYGHLKQSMIACGLKDIHLKEGARSEQRRSVEDTLNLSPIRDEDMWPEYAQTVLCDYLRSVDKNITVTDNEQIVTATQMAAALKEIDRLATESGKPDIMVINRDYKTLAKSPFVAARIVDDALQPEDAVAPKAKDLVSSEEFVMSMALPSVGKNNLKAVWEKTLSDILGQSEDAGDVPQAQNTGSSGVKSSQEDDSLQIAENRHSTGLALTTVIAKETVGGKDVETSVHIMANSARGRMVVVAGNINPQLQDKLLNAGISYVNRNEPNARSKAEAAINDLTSGVDENTRKFLRSAFSYRNHMDEKKDSDKSLSELLVAKDVESRCPKRVVAPKFGTR